MIIVLQVRSIGMDSGELLKLVETCPSGAETLITRILHIITEKGNLQAFFLLDFCCGTVLPSIAGTTELHKRISWT